MFKKSLLIAGSVVIASTLVTSSAFAEFAEKPTYANTIKAKNDKKEASLDVAQAEKDKAGSESSRAMLKSEEKFDKDKSVLKKTHSGRVLESNKHIE